MVDVPIPNQPPTAQHAAREDVRYVSNVDKNVAMSAAINFYKKYVDEQVVGIQNVDSIVDWEGETAIYIVNFKPYGYVMTSADIRNEPILSYSEKESFIKPREQSEADLIPDGFSSLVFEAIVINKMIKDNDSEAHIPKEIPISNGIKWVNLTRADNIIINSNLDNTISTDPCFGTATTLLDVKEVQYGEYCKTTWGQGTPYNFYAPNHYPTGCVAVATAQIMKFHSYPNTFNWSIMPNSCVSNYSNMTSGDYEVAKLLRNIGINVNMKYAAGGSGAYSADAKNALVTTYGYSKQADYADFDYNKIYTELINEKHPIYVDGCGTKINSFWTNFFNIEDYTDCHAYIIDGYRYVEEEHFSKCRNTNFTITKYYLHYNYGWDGRYDNWFSRCIWDVSDSLIDIDRNTQDKFPNYKYKKRCIYHITP